MSTPPAPHNNGNDINPPVASASAPGPPAISGEELIRDWIGRRLQFANAIQAHHPQHLVGLPGGMPSLALQHYPYYNQHQIAALNPAQVNAAIPANLSQHAADILRNSIVQAQMQAQSSAMNYHPLAHMQAQPPIAQQEAEAKVESQLPNEGSAKPPAAPELAGNSMEEALKKKITQKIQEKLKAMQPKITTEKAAAMENLLQEQPQQQQTQTSQINMDLRTMLEKQLAGYAESPRVLDSLFRDNSVGQSIRENFGLPMNAQPRTDTIPKQHGGPIASQDNNAVANNMNEVEQKQMEKPTATNAPPITIHEVPPIKRRKRGLSARMVKKQEKAQERSLKLDATLAALEDHSIRSAVIEDREIARAKRTEMQQIYEGQIKDMESRLKMYTELEGLAEQIADLQSAKSKSKSSRASNTDGALDMIHLSLKNYRMLEDTADRILDIEGRSGGV